MKQIIFATSNDQKLLMAQKTCADFGIAVVQKAGLHIDEIQGEDGELIARHKANEVYKILQQPCVITDDTWTIPALNGFPGPYMKSINEWFRAEDWLRLTHDLGDRRIILRQIVVYQDENGQHVFAVGIEGTLLKEIRGRSPNPNQTIISLEEDGRSIAEVFAEGKSALERRHTSWHEFAVWYSSSHNTDAASKTTSQQR